MSDIDIEISRLIDKQAIKELLSRYFLCWDTRRFDLENLRGVFTEDVKVKLPPSEVISGLTQVSELHVSLSEQFESTHHMTSDILYNFISHDSAEVRANLSAYHLYAADKRDESNFLIVRGIVNCSVLRVIGEWRIAKLNIESVYRF